MTILDVKQAADTATAYFAKLMPVSDIRLEEVEISDDERYWHITLSGLVAPPKVTPSPMEAFSSISQLLRPELDRIYRVFKVDAADGSVRSMKIRELALG